MGQSTDAILFYGYPADGPEGPAWWLVSNWC
jgi:hypothetical protein